MPGTASTTDCPAAFALRRTPDVAAPAVPATEDAAPDMVPPTEDAALDAPAAVEVAGPRAFDNSQAALPGSSLRPILVARETRLAVLAMNPPVLIYPCQRSPCADRGYPPIKALFVTKSKSCRLGQASGALADPVPYRPVPGIAIYHVSVDHYAVMIAEHDLAGPQPCLPMGIRWLLLIRDVPHAGQPVIAPPRSRTVKPCSP